MEVTDPKPCDASDLIGNLSAVLARARGAGFSSERVERLRNLHANIDGPIVGLRQGALAEYLAIARAVMRLPTTEEGQQAKRLGLPY